MSVYLYDESVVDTVRSITGDDRVHIVSPDESFSFLAQFDKDKVKLPAIVISRGPVRLLDYRNQVVALKGETARVTEDNLVLKAQLIPIRIEWSINVYTVDRYSCDEIIRELVFYIVTHPRFNVKVPYNLGIDQNFDVFLSEDIEDNTDLADFKNRGEYFRETLTIYTENAHFYSSHLQYPVYSVPDDVDIIKNKACERRN